MMGLSLTYYPPNFGDPSTPSPVQAVDPSGTIPEKSIAYTTFSGTQVKTGEKYKFTFSYNSNLVTDQSVGTNLQDKFDQFATNYKLITVSKIDGSPTVQVTVEITNNPLPFLVVFGAVIAGLAFLTFGVGLQLNKIERITESSPVAATSLMSIIPLGMLLGVIIGLKTLFK